MDLIVVVVTSGASTDPVQVLPQSGFRGGTVRGVAGVAPRMGGACANKDAPQEASVHFNSPSKPQLHSWNARRDVALRRQSLTCISVQVRLPVLVCLLSIRLEELKKQLLGRPKCCKCQGYLSFLSSVRRQRLKVFMDQLSWGTC
uniref:Uncharacterized protein n=1 Tax=Ascaris lumbricoides TaxID=6252 RepID=A0A0M3HQE8_ASCLU